MLLIECYNERVDHSVAAPVVSANLTIGRHGAMPQRRHRDPLLDAKLKPSRLTGSAADIAAAFRELVKRIRCPHCSEPFTDAAVDWGDAWSEGRRDTMSEFGEQERDGPCKIQCERCGERSRFNYFAETASKDRPK